MSAYESHRGDYGPRRVESEKGGVSKRARKYVRSTVSPRTVFTRGMFPVLREALRIVEWEATPTLVRFLIHPNSFD